MRKVLFIVYKALLRNDLLSDLLKDPVTNVPIEDNSIEHYVYEMMSSNNSKLNNLIHKSLIESGLNGVQNLLWRRTYLLYLNCLLSKKKSFDHEFLDTIKDNATNEMRNAFDIAFRSLRDEVQTFQNPCLKTDSIAKMVLSTIVKSINPNLTIPQKILVLKEIKLFIDTALRLLYTNETILKVFALCWIDSFVATHYPIFYTQKDFFTQTTMSDFLEITDDWRNASTYALTYSGTFLEYYTPTHLRGIGFTLVVKNGKLQVSTPSPQNLADNPLVNFIDQMSKYSGFSIETILDSKSNLIPSFGIQYLMFALLNTYVTNNLLFTKYSKLRTTDSLDASLETYDQAVRIILDYYPLFANLDSDKARLVLGIATSGVFDADLLTLITKLLTSYHRIEHSSIHSIMMDTLGKLFYSSATDVLNVALYNQIYSFNDLDIPANITDKQSLVARKEYFVINLNNGLAAELNLK